MLVKINNNKTGDLVVINYISEKKPEDREKKKIKFFKTDIFKVCDITVNMLLTVDIVRRERKARFYIYKPIIFD